MKTEDQTSAKRSATTARPTPEERLVLLFTARRFLRPAYEFDLDMSMAWLDVLGLRDVLDVLPIVTEFYWLAAEGPESFHRAQMAQLTEPAQHAYVDRLEASEAFAKELGSLTIQQGAWDALRPICEAANATARENTAWHCADAARDIRAAYADLRMAINASRGTPPAERTAVTDRYSLASIPARLARAMTAFVAEASPAISLGAPDGAARMLLGAQRLANEWCIPALARAGGNLQTREQHAEEVARWVSHGWGLLPECAAWVQTVVATICHASALYAPAANAEAAVLAAELAGEWQSVEDALRRLHAASHA